MMDADLATAMSGLEGNRRFRFWWTSSPVT
jgi:hypothetical protein